MCAQILENQDLRSARISLATTSVWTYIIITELVLFSGIFLVDFVNVYDAVQHNMSGLDGFR